MMRPEAQAKLPGVFPLAFDRPATHAHRFALPSDAEISSRVHLPTCGQCRSSRTRATTRSLCDMYIGSTDRTMKLNRRFFSPHACRCKFASARRQDGDERNPRVTRVSESARRFHVEVCISELCRQLSGDRIDNGHPESAQRCCRRTPLRER